MVPVDVWKSAVLLCCSPGDVNLFDCVKARQNSSTGDTSEDIGGVSFEEGGYSFVLQDLATTIEPSLVMNTGSGGHHHSSSDGVNWVRSRRCSNSHSVSKSE